jgi:hypothetical protein
MEIGLMRYEFYVDSVFTLRYIRTTIEKAIFHISESGSLKRT